MSKCKSCGNEVNGDFCSFCGEKVLEKASAGSGTAIKKNSLPVTVLWLLSAVFFVVGMSLVVWQVTVLVDGSQETHSSQINLVDANQKLEDAENSLKLKQASADLCYVDWTCTPFMYSIDLGAVESANADVTEANKRSESAQAQVAVNEQKIAQSSFLLTIFAVSFGVVVVALVLFAVIIRRRQVSKKRTM